MEDVDDPDEVARLTVHTCPQVLLRFGYGAATAEPTPRRSVKEMLLKEAPAGFSLKP